MSQWVSQGELSVDSLRIDSTVESSNIHAPSDSQLLNDGIRVLSRMMAMSKKRLGVKLRFVDQRKRSKSLAFLIFNAKNTKKQALHPKLLRCAWIVFNQVECAINTVELEKGNGESAQQWIKTVKHYRYLLQHVVDQTQRRVYGDEKVSASEKIFSPFEEHTDIIFKGEREVLCGHKINLATQENGFITYLNIEAGNPSDSA